jgi:apolipoprotein D and lipocalin family protein
MLGGLLLGCATIPVGIQPVTGFEVERYMGRWYEIKRLNHPFESSLTNVFADYRLMPDGTIEMISRGFQSRENRWLTAKSIASFVGNGNVASLKLAFDGAAIDDYNVLFVDSAYRYAIVTCDDRDGLWILSREPILDKSILDSLVSKAKEWQFPVEKMIYVEQKAKPLMQ